VQPRDVVLDSNVIARLALADDGQRAAARARLGVQRRRGARFVLTDTVVAELSATYRSQGKFERLLDTAQDTCEGILPVSANELFQLELTDSDPYTYVTTQALLPRSTFDAVRSATGDPEVIAFFEKGAFGNEGMKHLLDVLDPVAKKLRPMLPKTFREFAEERKLNAFKMLLDAAVERGHISAADRDLSPLWDRAIGWRFSTLVYTANEYRRVMGTHTKGPGCLSDLRICFEAAYSHELWTSDREFAACGQMANELCCTPKVTYWDPRA